MIKINKTMDYEDLNDEESIKIINELNDVIKDVRRKNLKVSSWCGIFDLTDYPYNFEKINRGFNYTSPEWSVDDINFPWFLYWEIIWIVKNNNFKKGDKLLDLGGCSSLFTYYMASKGLDVTSVDLNKELADNANDVAEKMGWNLKNISVDMIDMDFSDEYDHVTSICVYEHIPLKNRIKINKKIKSYLKDKGTFSITFDYKNPSSFVRINNQEDIIQQFTDVLDLKLRGNKDFFDNNIKYLFHPFYSDKVDLDYKKDLVANGWFSEEELGKTKNENDYTFGSLFFIND